MVRVRALQDCVCDNTLRRAGEEFDYDKEFHPSVLVAVADTEPTKRPRRPKKLRGDAPTHRRELPTDD